ncbi:Uncharacterised protein [Trueperella bialowiezensis]|uniref:site-specific DNA-methyltransferase (adenine-specific) n=1 Tax=Trueperella bialowiezensis TaxID=312285 RepID=A0A3S4V7Q9_9ACTO|nr:Uncharacterised protein [Trueperella bialowiezensis]
MIAYKELRRLEHAILDQIVRLENEFQENQLTIFTESRINVENFYGIEIDDFAVEVAILSLWIAKHQMNVEFREKFGISIPLIPLRESGNVVAANAARIDWNEVCPNDGETEIYLISNPPYLGHHLQSPEQKEEFALVLDAKHHSRKLDYVTIWLFKGAQYIKGSRAKVAFVTTNSVAQGEHVGMVFPYLFEQGVEIGYAYTSFKWDNNAKKNAGVTVVVISLRNVSSEPKFLYTDDFRVSVDNISPYLTPGPTVVVSASRKILSSALPAMAFGSKPTDGGHLVLNPREYSDIVAEFPEAAEYVRKYMGATEFINGVDRYCLWIEDDEIVRAQRIPEISKRLDAVAEFRAQSKAPSTIKFAQYPNQFKQRAYKPTDAIIVPRVSSERRDYIPMGYLGPETVISDAAFAVYDAEPWLFAILTSRMHMAWTRAVGGQLETRLRYSNTIVYNNFPVPELTDEDKEKLDEAAFRVLDVREYHSEKTLAELYDPDLMPENLRDAHERVDALVDGIYRKKPFETDEERLALLFEMYQEMSQAEGKTKK